MKKNEPFILVLLKSISIPFIAPIAISIVVFGFIFGKLFIYPR
jgi:hypothetical protein